MKYARVELGGLNIDSPFVTRTAENFRLPSWPPPPDFPIVIDAHGKIISRYSDSTWRLWPWANKAESLNFGDGHVRAGGSSLTSANADLLRQIVAWWLYRPRGVRNARSLSKKFSDLRPLFVLASREGIDASELSRFPVVADKLSLVIPPSVAVEVLMELHRLFEYREELGFVILDREGLRRFESALPAYEGRQTPYIPPRIWSYQVGRLRAFLDDFHAHRKEIEDCYRFCLDAYARNYGSLARACDPSGTKRLKSHELPFIGNATLTGRRTGRKHCGPFSKTARRFGIHGLLERWVLGPGSDFDGSGRGIRLLGYYFSMVGYVGLAYLLNFSLMRLEEGWSLRGECLEVEVDEHFGPIYLLVGPTTKTIVDGDARWVVSPSAKIAVEAMSCVSRLRMIAAEASPSTPTSPEDLSNPHLVVKGYEPWANAKGITMAPSTRSIPMSYAGVVRSYPNLFDLEQLRIQDEDLKFARLMTPSLDAEVFAVGKIWPLAWHQLRRTGAVNMQASGLVSDASAQYQLKHASRQMTLYYGQGRSRLRLNSEAQNEYIRTMYEVLGKEISNLLSDRFVSPYGDKRKAEMLRLVSPNESKLLATAAKTGKVSYRETLLGGCTKIGPCEFGGIDTIARCGGGDGRPPCADALFDREKDIRGLGRIIAAKLIEAPDGSPEKESLVAQQRAVENTLNVLAS